MYPTTDATESRFVPLEANFEYLTQHQNTKQTVDFSRLKARDPFVKAQPDPDYNPKIAKSHVAIVRLANSKGHDFDGLFKKPF